LSLADGLAMVAPSTQKGTMAPAGMRACRKT
jgi:hypothetical protein